MKNVKDYIKMMGICLFCTNICLGAAYSYVGIPKGMIYLAYVEYEDPNTVTITCGYGECNGHYWEIVSPADYDLTSLSADEDYHYIYIDDDAFVYPAEPVFTDSTTEPIWSDEKLGWYNGDDRCIGVVWSSFGNPTIMEYIITSDLKLVTKNSSEYIKMVLQNGNPNGTEIFLESTAYIPINARGVRVTFSNEDGNGFVRIVLRIADASYAALRGYGYYGSAGVSNWLELPRNSSRDFYWIGDNDDDNYFAVHIDGYQIER